MSLDSTLRGLAAEIGQSRTPTGSVAAPAKLRHRTGSITAYTQGDLTASVQIGGDIVDAPFLATYNPTVGDAVSVLINNGSPLILGAVNRAPAASGAPVIAAATYRMSTPAWGAIVPDTLYATVGDYATYFEPVTVGGVIGIRPLVPGWYQCYATVAVSGFTDGDVVLFHGASEGSTPYFPGTVIGNLASCPLWTPGSGSSLSPYVLSPPLEYNGVPAGSGVLRASTELAGPNIATTAAFLSDAWLVVYKIGDNFTSA